MEDKGRGKEINSEHFSAIQARSLVTHLGCQLWNLRKKKREIRDYGGKIWVIRTDCEKQNREHETILRFLILGLLPEIWIIEWGMFWEEFIDRWELHCCGTQQININKSAGCSG